MLVIMVAESIERIATTYVYFAHLVHLYLPSTFSQAMQILSAGIMGGILAVSCEVKSSQVALCCLCYEYFLKDQLGKRARSLLIDVDEKRGR